MCSYHNVFTCWWTLGRFQVSLITNKTSMNICLQVFVYAHKPSFFLKEYVKYFLEVLHIRNIVAMTVLMFLSTNSIVYISFLCQLQLMDFFLLIMSYIFLILCIPGNFFIWSQIFDFYIAGCWVFLYSWPLFWVMVKLPRNNLILLGLSFMLFQIRPEQRLVAPPLKQRLFLML